MIFFSHNCTFFLHFQRFKEAINGPADAEWSLIEAGVDDVCISVNPSLIKVINCSATFNNGLPLVSSSVLYTKASKLLHISFTLHLEFVGETLKFISYAPTPLVFSLQASLKQGS
jgi:hypothetical protein